MTENDHRRVIAELDTLAEQVAGAIQRFEATGFTAVMKDDYVALHALQHRVMEMRLEHSRAISDHVAGTEMQVRRH